MKYFLIALSIFHLPSSFAEAPSSMFVYSRFRGGLDPARVFNPFEESLIRCTFQSLVKVDRNGRITGDLAKSWHVSPDFKSVEFVLNDAKFQNGNRVQPEDIVRSFQRLTSSGSTYLQKQLLLDLIDRNQNWISVRGPNSVRVQFAHSYAPILHLLTSFEFLIVPPSVAGFQNGSGRYSVTIKKENEEFAVLERTVSNPKPKTVKVSYDFSQVESALESGQFDIVAAVPIYYASSIGSSKKYRLVAGNRYSPLMFELNQTKTIFSNSDFRRDLRSLLWGMVDPREDNQGFMVAFQKLIPPGLMLPSYYQKQTAVSSKFSDFKKRWSKWIAQETLTIWIPKHFFPEPFVEQLQNQLQSLKGVRIAIGPIIEFKELFDKNIIDVSTEDPSAYFADPDSFLYLWKSNRPNFPFSGERLMLNLQKYRHTIDPQIRLTEYARVVENFENENWVIPLYQTRYPIFYRPQVDLPDVNLMTFNLLCP